VGHKSSTGVYQQEQESEGICWSGRDFLHGKKTQQMFATAIRRSDCPTLPPPSAHFTAHPTANPTTADPNITDLMVAKYIQ
jgi:hypothetical protein